MADDGGLDTYTITTPRGDQVDIQAPDQATAIKGAQTWDMEDHASSEAARLGVDPHLALGVMRQESRSNPMAVSPKGAMGPMQLTAGTAHELGVDPTDAYQNITGGITYLKQQMDAFGGDKAKALAAYNAGPEAVRKYGGVPPFAETQAYVKSILGDQPTTDQNAPPAPAPDASPASPAPQGAKGGVSVASIGGPSPTAGDGYSAPMAFSGPPGSAPPNVPVDAGLGLIDGVKKAAGSTLDSFANIIPGLGFADRLLSTGRVSGSLMPDPLHVIGSLASRVGDQVSPYIPRTLAGQVTQTLGQYLPAAALPGSAPARAANVLLPTMGTEIAKWAANQAGMGPDVQQIAGMVGGVVGGGAASARLNPGGQANIQAAVNAARDAAYARVRANGSVIPQPAMQNLADSISSFVAEKAGPEGATAYPAAHAMVARIGALAKAPDGVTLPQLDTLRSDIYPAMIASGDREAPMGVKMRELIDGTISNVGDPDILAARDLNTRAEKIGTIQDEVRSAILRAKSTNSGENTGNAIRQELRPLIDPTRNQQINNFTPEELQAMNSVVEGTPSQNNMRYGSNLLRNKFLQGALAAPTKMAAPIAMEFAGKALNNAAINQTKGNANRVVNMIAAGNQNSAAPPIIAQRGPPLLSAPDTNPLFIGGLLSALPAMSAAQPRPLNPPRLKNSASRK